MSGGPVTFLATFPPIQSAIKVDGAGGARVQLDIPETELPAIARLLLLRGVVLQVTVQAMVDGPVEDHDDRTQVLGVRSHERRSGRKYTTP